jgi:hypothetical protein
MELLKVFVGDGTATAATSVATMTPGDLLLLDAATYTPVLSSTSGLASKDLVIAACINKNGVNTPVFSAPIKRANVKHINGVKGVAVTQEKLTATLPVLAGTSATVSSTFSLGVQIKEDLRMGTYNKNTEIIASATTPSTAYLAGVYTNVSNACMADVTSTIAKGFAANPLTSAGSPSQLVNVTRVFTGTATAVGGASATFAVLKGGRQVTITGTVASAPTVGGFIDVNNTTYLVEAYDSTNKIITLDTGYQGATATGVAADTLLNKLATLTAYTFVFEGVAVNRTNRYEQNRVVDFIVIYPKGFADLGISVATTTALKTGIGTYAQVKDLEEKAYTNINPLINYREFPFEDFALNATSGTLYSLVTIAYTCGWGYNMMQSSQPEFLQTAVIAAPYISNSDFDVTSTADGFLDALSAWCGTTFSSTSGSPSSGTFDFS